MRLAGRGGIARALYVAATEQRVVVVRVFVKNTRRTPRREIEVALRREGGIAMTTVAELHERWSRDAGYREAYERLEPELEVARAGRGAHARGPPKWSWRFEWGRHNRRWRGWRVGGCRRR